MKTTESIKKGRGWLAHNRRDFITDNVDPTRTKDNIVLIDCPDLEKKYNEIFGEAEAEYNAKQKRNDRKIKSHYDEITNPYTKDGKRKDPKKMKKPFYELMVQLGNENNDLNDKKINELAPQILTEFVEEFQKKYGKNIVVIGAYIHMDEATPHLHLDYIPIGTEYKNGLSKQNSHSKAMAEMGYKDIGEKLESGDPKRDYHYWHDDLYKDLESISLKYGIERDNLHSTNKGVNIHEYKYQKDRAEELKEENAKLAKTNSELSLKNTSLETSNKKLEEDKENYEKTIEYSKTYKENLENSITNQDYKAKFNKLYNLVWDVVEPVYNKLSEYAESIPILQPLVQKLGNFFDNTNKIYLNEEIQEEDKSNDDYEL